MWLAIGPYGQKSLINTYSQMYFEKNDWCRKAKIELAIEPPEAKLRFSCTWREANVFQNRLCGMSSSIWMY